METDSMVGISALSFDEKYKRQHSLTRATSVQPVFLRYELLTISRRQMSNGDKILLKAKLNKRLSEICSFIQR